MQLLTVPQVAQVLGVRPARAYELIRDGAIPAVRLRRQVRVSAETLRAWIDGGGRPPEEEPVDAA